MTLYDLFKDGKPYTSDQFLDATVDTDFENEVKFNMNIWDGGRLRDRIIIRSKDEAVGFLFDRIELYGWYPASYCMERANGKTIISIMLAKKEGDCPL